MKNKTKLILIPCFSIFVSTVLIFTPLDKKISDVVLRTGKNIDERNDVLLLNIDDDSIENVGKFPWTRNVYGDILVALKNLGADFSVFDLTFVDESNLIFDPAKNSVIDGDAILKSDLKFFGKSVLAMMLANALDTNHLYDEKMSLDVISENDSVTPQFDAVWSPLDKFLSSSLSAGFVNMNPDSDGHTRKAHLVMKAGEKYYGTLMLAPILQKLGNPKIHVSKSTIVLKDAIVGGITKDVSIPRCADGSVIINFPAKKYAEYNAIPVWNVLRTKYLEDSLVHNISEMYNSGFFDTMPDENNPYFIYEQINYVRDYLSVEGADDEINDELYFSLRDDFFAACHEFFTEKNEGSFISQIDDEETKNYVSTYFDVCRRTLSQIGDATENVAAKVKGAICIIGTTASSTTDYGITLFEERYPNVGLHSIIANQILSENFVGDVPVWWPLALAVFLCFLFSGVTAAKRSTTLQILFGIILIFLTAATPFVLFGYFKIIFYIAIPFFALVSDFFFTLIFSFVETEKEKSFIRDTFGRYLSADVVDEILKDPEKRKLGGDSSKVRTAMFTDVQGFTTISEKLNDSEKLISLLNNYLTRLSDCVIHERGTIDKYEGDAIIAFFGAPIYFDDHAARACRAALEMKKAEVRLNEAIKISNLNLKNVFTKRPGKENDPEKINTRIGINSGKFTVGNVGTFNKMNYTMIGSDVNFASRLEGANKQFGSWIMISETVRNLIGDEFVVRRLDRVRVVGAENPIQLFELLEEKIKASDNLLKYIDYWDKAMQIYEKRDYKTAAIYFQKLYNSNIKLYPDGSKDKVALRYLRKCDEYTITPKLADWDGVENLSEK